MSVIFMVRLFDEIPACGRQGFFARPCFPLLPTLCQRNWRAAN